MTNTWKEESVEGRRVNIRYNLKEGTQAPSQLQVPDLATNVKLSQARAQAVVNALVSKHGIAAARLIPFGAGPYAPVATNRTEEGRAKNRRVELVEIATK